MVNDGKRTILKGGRITRGHPTTQGSSISVHTLKVCIHKGIDITYLVNRKHTVIYTWTSFLSFGCAFIEDITEQDKRNM